MNILLVTNLFPSPADPERGVFTLQLAQRLSELSRVTVVCPLPWFPRWRILSKLERWYQFALVPRRYQMGGLTVYSPKYPIIPKMSEAMHARMMRRALTACIVELHKEHRFDVINSQWLYPDSVAVDPVAQSLAIPHVATGLGCDVNHDLFDRNKRDEMLAMLNNTAALTVVSSDLKRVLQEQSVPATKVHTIANGVDVTQFRLLDRKRCRKELELPLDTHITLYVGRLSEEKNVGSLIKAFAALPGDNPAELVIVGDGPDRTALQTEATNLGIDRQVRFIGKVDHARVSLWMGSCNSFCLPSIREGCPNVVLEALGSGRPVIASRVGGIPDMVTDASGILFDPEQVAEITAALQQARQTDWDEAAIADSVKSRSWEHAAQQYLTVFQQVTHP